MTPRRAAALVAAALSLAPGAALACPACATRTGGGAAQSIALGAFILLPFAVSAVVAWLIRSERRPPSPQGPEVLGVLGRAARSEAE